MSASTFRVGLHTARDLIGKADQHHVWSTEDLADFVEGMLCTTLDEFARLRPELVETLEVMLHSHG